MNQFEVYMIAALTFRDVGSFFDLQNVTATKRRGHEVAAQRC